MKGLVVFLGPSLPAREAARLAPGCQVRPPARQGDVWRALEARPKAIALIDGVFESQPAVWHHELRAAIDSGVAVFGAASMGALRAAELAGLGMVGVGEVFRGFLCGQLVDDAEVALLHADAEHQFRPLTVPLVNVRHAVALARAAKALTARQARAFLQVAEATHYQRRSWATLPPLPARFKVDLKAADARECLQVARAFVASGAPALSLPRSNPSSFVRRARLMAVHREALERASRRPDAQAVADRGTRTLLLAAWGRSLGLQPEPAAVRRHQRSLRATVVDRAEQQRLAEALALEEVMLSQPERVLPDGPGRLEGLYAGHCAPRAVRRRIR